MADANDEADELERKYLIEIPDIMDADTAAHKLAIVGLEQILEVVREDQTVIGVTVMIERENGYRIRQTYTPDPFRRVGMLEIAKAEAVDAIINPTDED